MDFQHQLQRLQEKHEALVFRPNEIDEHWFNGVFARYRHPVVTADHVPLEWRFDLDSRTNPHLQERLGINAAFNPGAILHDGKFVLVVRVEGASFSD